MENAPIPENEPQRLHCLISMSVLDTKPEERFDRLTRIAQSVFNVPIVLISLVDSERQWFKSKQGTRMDQTSRDISFCGHAILRDDVFFVPDALKDSRFADNPLVTGPPNIRFYAGLPLSGKDGFKIGTLCIIDTKPRTLTDEDISTLRDLADCVEDELLLNSSKEQEFRLEAILDNVTEGVISLDEQGKIETFNHAAEKLFGYSEEHVLGRDMQTLISDTKVKQYQQYFKSCAANGKEATNDYCQLEVKRCDNSAVPVDLIIVNTPRKNKTAYTAIVKEL